MKWNKDYTRSLLGGIIFLAVAWYFASIIAFIIISAIMGAAGRPLMRLLAKIKIGKLKLNSGIRATIVLVVMISIVGSLALVLVPSITSQAEMIRQIDLDEVSYELESKLNPAKHVLRERGMVAKDHDLRDKIRDSIVAFLEGINLKVMFADVIGFTGSIFMSLFAILFMSFFFIQDEKLFPNLVLLFVSERNQGRVSNIILKVRKTMNRYFFGLLIEVSTMMVLLSIGGMVVGISNAILIGFIGGLLNVIPYLGPIIGASMGGLIVLITNITFGIDGALLLSGQILIVFALANLMDNFVLQPLIYSNSVQMHPMAVFITIYAGGMLGGPLGMIIAIPVVTVLRIIIGEFFGDDKFIQRFTKSA
jgi:predicted PurR-regulated permease PerM